jgi:AcrR family transcriptional regulator
MRGKARAARSPERNSRSDARANRERILIAATRVFTQRGLAADMREIAARAEVGVGTVYRHFRSRDVLVDTVVRRGMQELLGQLESRLEGLSPGEALGAMLHTAAEAHDRFGALAEPVLQGKVGDATDFMRLLDRILRAGITDGTFRPDLDVGVAASAMESVVLSGAFIRLARERSSADAANAFHDLFAHAVLRSTR